MGKFKDIALRWFILALFTVIGLRTLKYNFDFSIVFNNEFIVDLVIAVSCGVIIELICHYTKNRKSTEI